MPDASWIVPALAALGVPLLVGWLNRQVSKGDSAQQAILDRLERDVSSLQAQVSSKADSHQIEAVLAEVKSVGSKVESLNTLVLTELGKRPTREEMTTYCQTMHDRRP